ncbi:PilZ domain-containing protein [Sphingomonas glaciei]|uniref:PilZ domain-containing protein n=1 Tax=Sphingomonas glaciei TaxID=2938948 RepID=A0ABY5MU58_9SPHN|nr:PilZ domain-containing protein [Sphingomonas glaciei]UUR08038.1 PilZ domain-containing protein [Sphingomonas glaciei]
MDESSPVQNRRQRRANVLLTAVIASGERAQDVKLRNLSADGALVEGPNLPIEGSAIRFRKGDLQVPGTVVWVAQNRAGIHFDVPLTPEALLRHVPTPRPRVIPSFRRPGLAARPMTSVERSLEKVWGVPIARDPRSD